MKKLINLYTLIAALITIAYAGYYGFKLLQQWYDIPVQPIPNGGMITYYSESSILFTTLLLLFLTFFPRYIFKKITLYLTKNTHPK